MGDSPRGGEMSRRDRGDGHLLGVPDRTVTQNPQSKTKAPKGAAARTAAVLPLSGVVLFPPSGFPFPQMPHTGQRGACFFGWYHTQFSAFIFVQNMPEISLTSPLVYGNIHHAEWQKATKTGGKNNVDRRNDSSRNKHFSLLGETLRGACHFWI